jgi:glycosyltransferase involved in cell wall biosynthesis
VRGPREPKGDRLTSGGCSRPRTAGAGGRPEGVRIEVSFIVPAFNEAALIGATLEAIHAAARAPGSPTGPYEIIVADDASTDATAEIARAAGAEVVAVNRRQIAAVRNAGAAAARGDVLVFVDADTRLPAATWGAAIEALRGGAVGGGAAVRFDAVSLPARLVGGLVVEVFCRLRLAAGCFMFCRREAFRAVGGFDERYFASEEVWLSRALRRQGPFVMLREPVVTSGRKVRDHGLGRLLWIAARLLLGGPRAMRRRDGLDIWYRER